jgi:hypothetical protein
MLHLSISGNFPFPSRHLYIYPSLYLSFNNEKDIIVEIKRIKYKSIKSSRWTEVLRGGESEEDLEKNFKENREEALSQE